MSLELSIHRVKCIKNGSLNKTCVYVHELNEHTVRERSRRTYEDVMSDVKSATEPIKERKRF